MIKRILYIGAFLCLTAPLLAQHKNDLLDRGFWKGQPSLKEVKAKVKAGHSPTEMTEHNFDATGYAILEKAPLATIKYLLDQGNDVNKLTHDARTYLFWAAYKNNLELMKYLVKQDASLDIIDQHGYSVLMFAADTGQENPAIYDYLIELGADIHQEKDRNGRNAILAYASSIKTGEMLDYFIKKGLSVNSVDKDGNGIFHQAVKTGNQAFIERLIKDYEVSALKNPQTNENAILFASTRSSRSGAESSVEFYEYLEGLGLDPAIVSKDGNTVLHNLAYRSNTLALYDHFLKKGVDLNQLDKDGSTALINAASRRNKEVIAWLVDHTKDINVRNKEGFTAFSRALKYNTLEIAKLLANQGANTKVIDANGYDLGYHLVAAYRNQKQFLSKMNYLISTGYDPLNKQIDGSTLLHAAIKKEDIPLIKLLVGLGLDINAKDEMGQTILHHAAMQADDGELLKYLIVAGADKAAITEFEESAYDLANANEMLTQQNVNLDFLKIEGDK